MSQFRAAVSRPYVYPLLVSALSFTGFYSLQASQMSLPGVETFLAGVSAATFGSYLTIILVDHSFRKQQQNRRQRIQTAALRELRTDINRHLVLLGNMSIAASEEYPESSPQNYNGFLKNYFVREAQFLDFSKEYPTARDTIKLRWFDHTLSRLNEFQSSLDKVINQYSVFLEPELLNKLQNAKNTGFNQFLIGFAESDIMKLDQEKGYNRAYSILMGHEEMIQSHAEQILEIIREYEEYEDVDLIRVENLGCWSDNQTPHAGSARIDSE